MSIKNIFTNGVLVDINIHAWTGEKQLTASDLGISTKNSSKVFRLGRKTLVPPEILAQFKQIDNKARLLLIDRSYPFPFGNARFVPKKAFVEFAEEFEELQKSYMEKVNNLIENYDHYRIEMRTHFLAAAKVAYKRLSAMHNDELLAKKDEKGRLTGETLTEDEFINAFLDRIEKCYPTKEAIREKYSIEYLPFQMELPDLAQATIDDVAEENTKRDLLQRGYQLKMKKELESYAQKMVEENRARAEEVISTLKDQLNSTGFFSVKTHNKISNMIDNFRRLNVSGDDNIEAALQGFKKKYLDAYSPKEVRESDEIKNNMVADLMKLQKALQDEEKVIALAEAYKQKINL